GIEGRPQIDEHDEKIMPMENHGVKTMSLGLITDPDTPVIWRGPMVMKALDQFLTDVKWGELDFMIIDLPPGTGDAQLTLPPKVVIGGDTGEPIVVMDPASPAAQAFRELARQIVEQVESGTAGHTHGSHEHAHV